VTGVSPLVETANRTIGIIIEGSHRSGAAGAARRSPSSAMQVPPDAEVVDARGKVLTPGLVNVHCDINQPPEDMKRYWIAQLRWGVTTMRSRPYHRAPTFEPTTPDEARENGRKLKAQRVDFIKIRVTDPKFPPDMIAAIVDERRRQDIPIASHGTDFASLHQLADQRVTDCLYNPIDQSVNAELVAYAKANTLTFAPTLANIESRWFY
jgi:imidazolonepropionase-like amidohydrolase